MQKGYMNGLNLTHFERLHEDILKFKAERQWEYLVVNKIRWGFSMDLIKKSSVNF